ncbi:MAG: secretin and TonB N-terminal domain-containing protein [Syntrophaceae bacterium]|nr:secretin and TonB N-terminal domain-containing protein [Syntrophaceae bacterium]
MIESRNSNSIVAILANTYIPEDFRQNIGENKLHNIFNITASQEEKDGQPWGYVTMDLRERVPYMVRKDGSRVMIDFNVASLGSNYNATIKKIASANQKKSISTGGPGTVSPRGSNSNVNTVSDRSRLITIDFQDASIKSVLRLLAEEGGVNIVSSEDVKGNITLSVKKVTWQQAFDTVLALHSLGKETQGNVIIVKTMDRMRKESDAAYAELKKTRAASEEMKKAAQEELVKDGRLPQISIEAKIVEVSRDGTRDLGVLWGGAWKGSEVGFVGGNSPQTEGSTDTFGLTAAGWDDAGVAVNLPSAISAPNPTLGVIVATSNLLLAAKLEALETSGEGKIISSPKVTTLDNESANIGQGEEIPYVTRDKDGTPTITMKDAKLELDVKPKITSEGKISMEISASSKYADWKKVNKNNENPPLVASNVESKVVVKDGDTIVLGGIMKSSNIKSNTGVPWLSKIPVLGWLFKSESTFLEERELLIFVTPRIIKPT